MKKKVSAWSSASVPTLVNHYVNAHVEIMGMRPFVHKMHYGRFRVFEDELREGGYSYRDYAYTIVALLEKWCKRKGFKAVPVTAFTGDWALSKFKSVADSMYVSIPGPGADMRRELYYSELTVARSYIHSHAHGGDAVSMRRIVRGLKRLLSPHWLHRYHAGDDHFTDEVLEDLCEEYGIRSARTYNDIVDAIRNGNIPV